jgi:Uncharacterised nucleotidyltransferase
MLTYEAKLKQSLDWALKEGSMHFDERSAVHESLKRISKRLSELQIPYAVAGGMALFSHGFRRFTEDVDILVTPEGLQAIHRQLEGLGYVAPFKDSKQLRDTASGVRIEFLVAGQFPGDGKPKPVAFPDPSEAGIEIDGIRFLRLEKLIELKLASGMTNPGRLKDLADVQELIRLLKLDKNFEAKLDPYVREKFAELRRGVESNLEQTD